MLEAKKYISIAYRNCKDSMQFFVKYIFCFQLKDSTANKNCRTICHLIRLVYIVVKIEFLRIFLWLFWFHVQPLQYNEHCNAQCYILIDILRLKVVPHFTCGVYFKIIFFKVTLQLQQNYAWVNGI